MKNKSTISLCNFMFMAILLLLALSNRLYAQRCGDGIEFILSDKSEVFSDSTAYKVKCVVYDTYFRNNNSVLLKSHKLKYPRCFAIKSDSIYKTNFSSSIEWKENGFYIRTVCGMLEVHVSISSISNDSKMELTICNVPGDIPFKTETLEFSPGKYEVNLNCRADYGGYEKDKNGTYVLEWDKFIKTK